MQDRTTVLAGVALAVLALGTTVATQSVKPNPAIAKEVDRLKDAVKDKSMAHDAEAAAIVAALATAYDKGLHASDKKKVARALRDVLLRGKLRPADKIEIYVAASHGLAGMGVEGQRALQSALDKKRFPNKKEWIGLRAELWRDLGRTGEVAAIGFLCDHAKRESDDQLLRAIGEALGNYGEADQKARKEIAKTLIMRFNGIEGQSVMGRAGDPMNLTADNAMRTMRVIRESWNATLSTITGQEFTRPFDWQSWWNDNKRKNWDADAK